MKKATIVLIVMAVCTAAGSGRARAQTMELLQTGFVNVDAGAQPQRRTITASNSFSIYDETATVTAEQRIRNGGVFDISAGARVLENLAVGVGVSSFGRSGSGSVTASIPHPAFFDRRVSITSDTTDLKHTELGIHVRATWFTPVTDNIDISLSAGPSFIRLTQDLASTVSVQPGTQTITVVKETHSGNALGVNAGVDGNYMMTPRFGVGLFVRYTTGSVDLPTAPDFTVGGFQAGLGLRARF